MLSVSRIHTSRFIASAILCIYPFIGGYQALGAVRNDDALISVSTPVYARRGNILDRNGLPLSSCREVRSIGLLPSLFYSDNDVNRAISKLLSKAAEEGTAPDISAFPIDKKTLAVKDLSKRQSLLSAAGLENGVSDSDIIERLYDIFGIGDDLDNAFEVAAVRYLSLASGGERYTLFENAGGELCRTASALAQKAPFIYIETNYERYYPEYDGMTLCPHMIGLISAGDGIEGVFDRQLRGRNGRTVSGFEVLSGSIALKSRDVTPAENGKDITLTIDKDIQQSAQLLLADAINDGRCTAGSVVVCDTRSGDILALASAPFFDLNRAGEEYEALSLDDTAPLFDRSRFGLYRPGSAMKTITAYAALDDKKINRDTFLWCGRYFPLGDTTFSCLGYHGFEDVKSALRDSCNVFFYKCAGMLGGEKLAKYQSDFGLGSEVGIELDNAGGRVVTKESIEALGMVYGEGLVVQSAIGQSENAVTPLQMVQWAQIIANRGRLNTLGLLADRKRESRQVFENAEGFEAVTEGMVMAADNIWGEYSLKGLEHQAAIKTGTPENGHGYNSAVIGFYPADEPQVAFAVMLEDSESAYTLVKALLKDIR